MKDLKLSLNDTELHVIHLDQFIIRGSYFYIELKRTVRKNPFAKGEKEYCYCLYVIIGKNHRLFEKANRGKDDAYDYGDEIYPNWHQGCTFYQVNNKYIKIGCDYQHYGDPFLYDDSDEVPEKIKQDIIDLYQYFSKVN
jgi:hypothetical protein